MPSILFISLMNGAAWGGSEELWYRSAIHAAGKGYQITCAFYDWPEKKEKINALRSSGCNVILMENRGRLKKNLPERLRFKFSKWKAKNQVHSIAFQEYDLVVINQGGFEIYTSQWRSLYKKLPRYVLLFHNYDENEVFSETKSETVRNWITHASLNLFASQKIKTTIESKLDFNVLASRVLINPVSVKPPDMITPYPSPHETIHLVMLAALDTSRKAQDNLVKALSSRKWKERNWILELYGEGNDRKKLEQLITDCDLEDRIFLPGHVKNISEVLTNAHLVLQITHRDAMPLAVVEAMSFSRPLVVSDIGDMPVWVKEGSNGWVSRDASIQAIDETLEKAWNKKDHWPEMGIESYRIFRENYPPVPEEYFLKQLGL